MSDEFVYRKRTDLFLSRWKGAKVQIRKYGPAHGQLTIRIWKPDRKDEVQLHCVECEHICGPFEWDNCQIEVEYVGKYLGEQICFVRDQSAGFVLKCRDASAAEMSAPPGNR
jgi:hypothetical protein